LDVLVSPCVEVQAVEGDALSADAYFDQDGAHQRIEHLAIHA
jgi:hypothetical protein